MTYIENIFLCLALPLLLSLCFTRGTARRFTLFVTLGMGMCLLSAYVNGFLWDIMVLIDALPDAAGITADQVAVVTAQLEAIDTAKGKLSEDELAALDFTRYDAAAAALLALATPMLLTNDTPDEQFSLTPGGIYYFDLSSENIPGTANNGNSYGAAPLPDISLHYVPFTYVGTLEAYKLTSAMVTTEEYAEQNKYAHSLFVADYNVTHTVSWNDLNTNNLIFGKNYESNGIDYTLRTLSGGSYTTGSGDSKRAVPP